MLTSKPARTATLLAAATLVASLTGCAADPAALEFTPPTMAPEQTLDEACRISSEEIDRITRDLKQQFEDGLSRASSDIAAGRMPDFSFLSGSVEDTVRELQQQISNDEVNAALDGLRESLQGFGDIAAPDTVFGALGYLSDLNAQAAEVTDAVNGLQSLCGTNELFGN